MDDKDNEMEEVVIPVNGDDDTAQYIVSNEQSNSQQILTQGNDSKFSWKFQEISKKFFFWFF